MSTKGKLEKPVTVALAIMLILSIFMIQAASSSIPSVKPHLEVSPTSTTFGPEPALGKEFDVNMTIKSLEAEWHLVGIEFKLGYNNTLLEVVSITEGPFLRDPRWNWYGTYFISMVEYDHVVVGDLLLPNPNTGNYDQTEFPNGDGIVATIRFKILYQGVYPQVDTSPLNLYDIILSDKYSGLIPSEPPTNGVVTIIGLISHDVAITNVSTSKTVVCLGYNITINVALKNNGNYTDTFTVWTFCGLHQNITLPANTSITIHYTFSTSKLKKGTYTVWAYAPMPEDARPNDNIRVGTTFLVSIVGDITGPDGCPDGKVDMIDMWEVARHFGINYPDPKFNPNMDIDNNNKIDMIDMWITAKNFGKIDP
jgi:hypothetical protein